MRERIGVKDSCGSSCSGFFLFAAMFVLLLSPCRAKGDFDQGSSGQHPAVCRIQNRLSTSSNLGSGTLIERTDDGRLGLVLTCAHLFKEGVGEIVVTLSNKRTHGAKLVAIDRQADLAALMIANPLVQPAPVSFAVSRDERLDACGYGPHGVFRCAVGKEVGQAATQGQVSLMISGSVRSGDSGGGVFDQQGRLVAVIWGESQGVTYASYGKPLHRFLDRVLRRSVPANTACPNGLCPRRPRVAPEPRPPRQKIGGGSGNRLDFANSSWESLRERVEQLEKHKQDEGDYVTRADLSGYLRSTDLHGYARTEDLERSNKTDILIAGNLV